MRKMIFLLAVSMLTSTSGATETPASNAWKNPDYAVQVQLYRGYPPADTFVALNDLGQILVQNTAKGFIVRSIVERDGFHPGATFCLQVSPMLFNAKEVLAKILASIQTLKPEGQSVGFTIESPSQCLNRYFP